MNDPLTIPCPGCAAPAGSSCRTVKGKPKAVCKARVPLACGCPGVVDGLAGAHLPGCEYVAAAVSGRTTTVDRWVKEHQAAASTVPTPTAHDFDEHTPPPKTRPKGVPLNRYVKLPPGEDLAGIFDQWDREGRFPPGSILTVRIGLWPVGDGRASGYKLLAHAGGVVVPVSAPPGRELDLADLNQFTIAVEIVRGRDPARYTIFAPKKGDRP